MDAILPPMALFGTVAAIASKSDAHRVLIGAALADQPTELIMGDPLSEDLNATVRCLTALGASIRRTGNGLLVTPMKNPSPQSELDCGESGSTLRFLLPIAATSGKLVTFTASGRLPSRPMEPLFDQLKRHGCAVSRKWPLTVSGTLRGGSFTLPGDVSSQFATGLLLAAPRMASGCDLTLRSPIESKGYLEMTIRTLAQFRIEAVQTENGFRVASGQPYRSPDTLGIEGDWSNAAVWLVAGALGGGVTVTGLDVGTAQGDAAIVPLLERMGAHVVCNGDAVTIAPASLHSTEIDATDIPDLVPILAVAAAAAQGETRIHSVGRLRLKESDRLAQILCNLTALGVSIREQSDTLWIMGREHLFGGEVSSGGDHRMAMAMAIAATRCVHPLILRDVGAVRKSYPGFWDDFRLLGGVADGF